MSLDTIKTDGEIAAEIEELRYELRFATEQTQALIDHCTATVRAEALWGWVFAGICTWCVLKALDWE